MATKAAAPATRPRPYRDFLTPALHRQFTSASLLTLGVCYGLAVWMGEWDIFWQWFPLGFAGMRTLMLFLSALTIFVLRVSRTHVGNRTTTSPIATLWNSMFSVSTYLTFMWYLISVVLYTEVYLFGRSEEAKMGLIDYGRAHERAKMNGRSVAFRSLFLSLAMAYSFYHLYTDKDKVPYPLRSSVKGEKDAKGPTVKPAIKQLQDSLYSIAYKSGVSALTLTFPGLFIYIVFFKTWAWNKFFTIARYIHFLPATQRAHQTTLAPFTDLLGRLLVQSFLLVFLWEFTNAAFSAYISQEPLKKGQPLTDDSKDPNGSLLVGLKAKKEFAKATAFRELALITARFPTRRQTVYSELDRANGPTYTQIQTICLAEINAIKSRIEALNAPAAPPPSAPDVPDRQPITAPLKTGPIYVASAPPATPRAKVANYLENVVRKQGNNPGAAPLRDALQYSSQKLLTDGQKAKLSPAHLQNEASGLLVQIVHSPVGYPFRQPFARVVSAVVFGGGEYSKTSIIINAVDALTALLVSSLKEDKYGEVSKSVPTVIRAFASTISAVEAFLSGTDQHWSDIDAKKWAEDVEVLLQALRQGLEGIFGGFGEYLEGLGMGPDEVRSCKAQLVSKRRVEMEQVGSS